MPEFRRYWIINNAKRPLPGIGSGIRQVDVAEDVGNKRYVSVKPPTKNKGKRIMRFRWDQIAKVPVDEVCNMGQVTAALRVKGQAKACKTKPATKSRRK